MILLFASLAHAQGAPSSDFRFGGQFRLNLFAEQSTDGNVQVLGERIRLRPTTWMEIDDRVKGMLQLEANQVDNAFAFRARYADAAVRFGKAWVHVGLLPLSDRFGDTLFSASWDFNPLAVSVESDEGDWHGRIAGGLVFQGADPTSPDDDVALLLADLDRGIAGVSVVSLVGATNAAVSTDQLLVVPGARIAPTFGDFTLSASVLGSALVGDDANADTALRSLGVAGRVEGKLAIGASELAALVVYATGGGIPAGSMGHAFVTPMSQLGFHGYWGYTGRLTVQGPTDQGIDDPYNIDGGTYDRSNLGRGMATGQVRATVPVSETVVLTGATGAFLPAEGGLYGLDVLGQLTWKPVPQVSLDSIGTVTHFGADHHARANTSAFLFATRLQMEF